MTLRWKILVGVLCGVIAVVAVCFFCLREKEPSYNRRTLSEWLRQYENSDFNTAQKEEARSSALHIGTNAIPTLLRFVEQARQQQKLVGRLDEMPVWFFELSLRLNKRLTDNADQEISLARVGFELLGPNASAAVPRLMQCFESSIGIENGMFIGHIAEIIASIGEPALPPLMQIANGSGTNFQRGLVLMTIGTIGREAGSSSKIQIRDLLLKVFRDKSERCRYEALEALTQMRCCPEIVVPEISRELNSESNLTKAQMLIALERYGRQARPAAAEMIRLLHDKDPLVRQVTTNTLRTIAPDLLRGAATKN